MHILGGQGVRPGSGPSGTFSRGSLRQHEGHRALCGCDLDSGWVRAAAAVPSAAVQRAARHPGGGTACHRPRTGGLGDVRGRLGNDRVQGPPCLLSHVPSADTRYRAPGGKAGSALAQLSWCTGCGNLTSVFWNVPAPGQRDRRPEEKDLGHVWATDSLRGTDFLPPSLSWQASPCDSRCNVCAHVCVRTGQSAADQNPSRRSEPSEV